MTTKPETGVFPYGTKTTTVKGRLQQRAAQWGFVCGCSSKKYLYPTKTEALNRAFEHSVNLHRHPFLPRQFDSLTTAMNTIKHMESQEELS